MNRDSLAFLITRNIKQVFPKFGNIFLGRSEKNADVMGAVEQLAFSFDPTEMGYERNEEECQIYQSHYPEKLGYQVVRPVKRN